MIVTKEATPMFQIRASSDGGLISSCQGMKAHTINVQDFCISNK